MAERNISHLIETLMGDDTADLLRRLGRAAEGAGTNAYVVGGVVRDALLGIPNQDLDVVVEGDGEAFAQSVADDLGGSLKAHTRFGTAIVVLPGGRKIDVASARSEAYERPGALPDVKEGSLEEDLRRRDFTINAMAVRMGRDDFGDLVDLYGGQTDLDGEVLRALTERSFVDDPTRVLRGIRFSARFGFAFEETTERLLRDAVADDALSTVSGERIMNEIALILGEERPWPPVERLIEWGVLAAIDDGWTPGKSVRVTFERLEEGRGAGPGAGLADDDAWWRVLFLATVESIDTDRRERVLDRLRAGRALREMSRGLDRFDEKARPTLESAEPVARSRIHRLLSGVPDEVLALRLATERGTACGERVSLYVSELRHVQTTVGGDDLAELGLGEGRRVGELLQRLLEARLDREVASDEEERALAARLAKDLDALNKN